MSLDKRKPPSVEDKGVGRRIERVQEAVGTIVIAVSETGRHTLRPQPSLDPNDPLNWPQARKYVTYITVCVFAALATASASKFAVAIGPVAEEFGVTAVQAGYLVGINVLLLGCGSLFWVPLMRCVGKRPIYVASIPLLAVANGWSYKASSFGSLLAASALSGFAASAGGATGPAVVADLFFVHERGTLMMVFHVALSCGFFLGPLINAYVIQYSGWRAECLWMAVAAFVTWAMAILNVHETSYLHRDVSAPQSSFEPRRSPAQCWGLSLGYDKDANFLRAFADTIAVVAYPPVLWAGLTVGIFVGWNTIVQLTSLRTFTAAPYDWVIRDLGLLSISGFVGAMLSTFFGGKLIDLISSSMTKRAHGQREPEYRLPALIIPAVVGPTGILLFGLTVADKRHWILPAVGYAMQGFGLAAASNIVVTYTVDSYLPLVGEALVTVFVVQGIIGCVLSLFAFNWITATGTKNAFGQMVAIQCFMLLFVIVFLVFGKRIRAATARFGPMAKISM